MSEEGPLQTLEAKVTGPEGSKRDKSEGCNESEIYKRGGEWWVGTEDDSEWAIWEEAEVELLVSVTL